MDSFRNLVSELKLKAKLNIPLIIISEGDYIKLFKFEKGELVYEAKCKYKSQLYHDLKEINHFVVCRKLGVEITRKSVEHLFKKFTNNQDQMCLLNYCVESYGRFSTPFEDIKPIFDKNVETAAQDQLESLHDQVQKW
jgi:hypothetical protein